jgi:hypothetical protein
LLKGEKYLLSLFLIREKGYQTKNLISKRFLNRDLSKIALLEKIDYF